MVDSINPAGQIQNIQSTKSTAQKAQETRGGTTQASSEPVDEVQISQEALSFAQAEDALKNAASALASDNSLTLSNDVERLNALV